VRSTRSNHTTPRARRGFTLIELLIVIAILLAIGGLVVVNLIPRGEQAKTDLQRVQLKQIADAFEHFRLDMDRWPTEEEGIESLWNKDQIQDENDQQRWRGPYLTEPVLQDRWGHDLVYRFPGELRGETYYDLISLGPDGEEKTEDDITNVRPGEQGELAKDSDFGAPSTTLPPGASPGGS
jgi:general secretion pathway protein G